MQISLEWLDNESFREARLIRQFQPLTFSHTKDEEVDFRFTNPRVNKLSPRCGLRIFPFNLSRNTIKLV